MSDLVKVTEEDVLEGNCQSRTPLQYQPEVDQAAWEAVGVVSSVLLITCWLSRRHHSQLSLEKTKPKHD